MSNPDLLDKVKKWMSYAEDDLRLAEHGLKLKSSCPYRLISYHAQQCAEKYIKAFLVLQNIDFPYTHNISRLLELIPPESDLPAVLQESEELTPYAITTRYPAEDEEVTRDETIRAIRIAKHVRDVIKRKISNSAGI